MTQTASHQPTAQENMILWEMAKPLQIAHFDLADPTLVARYHAIGAETYLEALMGCGFTGKNSLELSQMVRDVTNKHENNRQKREAISGEIRQNFADLVLSGDVRCFGFEIPRMLNSSPVELLPEHWKTAPIWETGELKYHGLHIAEIRVLTLDAVPTPRPQPTPMKVGRPTVKPHIEAAFHALDKDGLIDVTRSAMGHYPLIRQWIAEHVAGMEQTAPHLTNEGIRAHFAPLFKRLKGSRKQ